MNIELIKIFGVAVSEPNESVDFASLNTDAVKKGYIVHPDACTKSVKKFIDELNVDYNSTFYKTFEDVLSKSRFELFIDQVCHYASTYGTDFQGEAWVPNNEYKDTQVFVFDKYKVITAVSVEEMCNKCLNLMYSGIAMKQETIDACVDFVYTAVVKKQFNKENIDIDKIQNREALVVMCSKFGMYPNNAISLFRYIVYAVTNETLLIKNKTLIDKIKSNSASFNFKNLTEHQIVQLSTIFFRYKPLFLAFKGGKNSYVINKIRRLAEKNHKPLKVGMLEAMLNADYLDKYATGKVGIDMGKFNAELENCTNFKLIRLIQILVEKTVILMACMENKGVAENKNMYIVRNGKVFFKNSEIKYNPEQIYNIINVLKTLKTALKSKLIENLKNNIEEGKTATYIPVEGLYIACPVSEKNFVGNYPNGTRYALKDDNVFGIFWKNEWGTRDFDLSYQDIKGNRISWNSGYYDHRRKDGKNTVVYSGDMTDANPHATECIKFAKDVENGIFSINRYNGREGSKFEIFMSQSNKFDHNKIKTLPYMVDPNTIVFKSDCISDKSQKMLGIVCDGNMYLSNLSVGNGIVANYYAAGPEDIYNIYVLKSKSVLYLYQILEEAGYKKVDDETKDENTIDFRNSSKADIIALFS